MATEHNLAYVEALERANIPRALNPHNRVLIYESRPLPRVYVIPVEAILGKLAVVPAGDTGKINDSFPSGWFDSSGRSGTAKNPEKGSALYYVNTWAMDWAKDAPVLSPPIAGGAGQVQPDCASASDSAV